jgi:type IV secretion system protein VirD4
MSRIDAEEVRKVAKHVLMVTSVVLLLLLWFYGSIWLDWLIDPASKGQAVPVGWHEVSDYFGAHAGIKRFSIVKTIVGATSLIAMIFMSFGLYLTKRPLHGDARFATRSEVTKAGLFAPKGILIGRAFGRYLVAGLQSFVALAAPTRSGKGVGVVIPNLLNWTESVVCMDMKLELWRTTSKYRKAVLKQSTFLFCPFAVDLMSHHWNPLDEVSRDPIRMPGDVLQIAQIFYPERAGDKNIFFVQQAQNLFFGLTLFLVQTNHERCTLGEVARQGAGYDKPLRDHLKAILDDHKGLSRQCRDALSRSLSQPDEVFGNIKASFDAPLLMFANPTVDAATSSSDFSLANIRRQRVSIYFGVTPDRLDIAAKLINLFFTQAITLNTGVLPEDDKSLKFECLLLMDEFAAFGRVSILSKAVSFVAGYGLRLVTIIQSKSQIEGDGLYSQAEARNLLVNHDIKVIFTPGDDSEAKDASEMLGTYTERARSVSSNRSTAMLGSVSGNAGENISEVKRSLMLPDELKRMEMSKELIDKKGCRPILCDKIFYYSDPIFVDRLKMVSPSLRSLGKALPTREQLDAARIAGELAAPVRMLSIVEITQASEKEASDQEVAVGFDGAVASQVSQDGVLNTSQIFAAASKLAAGIMDWSVWSTGEEVKDQILKVAFMNDFFMGKGGSKNAV